MKDGPTGSDVVSVQRVAVRLDSYRRTTTSPAAVLGRLDGLDDDVRRVDAEQRPLPRRTGRPAAPGSSGHSPPAPGRCRANAVPGVEGIGELLAALVGVHVGRQRGLEQGQVDAVAPAR